MALAGLLKQLFVGSQLERKIERWLQLEPLAKFDLLMRWLGTMTTNNACVHVRL